jgi:MFS family permease
LTRQEKQAVIIMSFIIALRLLGIFLLLPIFSVYAIKYPGATLPLVGVAFGIYALAQCVLQIPFGWASDRFGRRPVLLIGLFLFSLGSLVCGMAGDITHLILARVLQGSGAVSAVAMATLGDLTRPQVRAQAFTVAGIAVGVAFTIGLLGGPFVAARFGFNELFYLLAILSFLAMLVTGLFLPKIKIERMEQLVQQGLRLGGLMNSFKIRRLYLAALILSFVLNLFFFIYPLDWVHLGLDQAQLWKVYLAIFLPSLLFVFPYVRHAEKQGKLRLPVMGGWIFIILSFFVPLLGGSHRWILYTTGAIFFLGYTLFQALLPAFLTQQVPSENRGAATGIYNLASFLGSSLGGMLTGVLYHSSRVFPLIFGLVLLILWIFIGLPKPPDSDVLH